MVSSDSASHIEAYPVSNGTSARRRHTSAIGWHRRRSATRRRADVEPTKVRQRLATRHRASIGPIITCQRMGLCWRTDNGPMHEGRCIANPVHTMLRIQFLDYLMFCYSMYYVSEHPVWYLYRTKRAIAACNRDLRVGVRLAALSEI